MKQKKIGDILYVYSTTAYEITQDTDAAVIKIQEECIPAYAALNASLVSKFQPINYKLFCVKHPEWADYMDDYYVHIASYIGEGTATATPNSGDEGEEITLSATPATGWEFVRFRAQPLHGSVAITVKDNKFTMPADDVRVQVEFDKIDFDITVDDQIQNGSLSAPETANLGDTVTITATPASGYVLDTLTVMCGSLEITVVNNQFTMPAGDVTITGTFRQAVVPYEQQYFTIESEADNNNINIHVNTYPDDSTHFYISLDNGESWTASTFEAGADYINNITLNTGDKMLIKRNSGNFKAWTDPGSLEDPIFNATYDFKVYGNVMSLIYGDNFTNKTAFPVAPSYNSSHNLMGLFGINDKLTDASNLILPATTLTHGCYASMFWGCTSLTTAPTLPATTLAQYCYSNMFNGCTSLTTAPVLPATTSAQYCYSNMFWGCTSLNEVTMLLEDIPTGTGSEAPDYLDNWLSNCSSTGTIYVSPNLTSDQKTTVFLTLPAGSETLWTVEDYVPAS